MNVKRKSQKQEKAIAKEFNASTVIASGAFWGNKADVRSEDFLVECKITSKDYYVVTSKVWEKISIEAIRDRIRIPLLVVDLRDSERCIIFNPNDFEDKFFKYSFGNTEENCSSQFRLKIDSMDDFPVAFYLKSRDKTVKKCLFLIAMRKEEFFNYYMKEGII